MVILFNLISMTPAIAMDISIVESTSLGEGNSVDCPADNGNGYAYDAWAFNWKCHIPLAFSLVENLSIDTRIVEGTPHWFFLAAGATEKQALVNYIDNANISKERKNEWIQFIRGMWKEHPVEFDNSTGNPTLVPGNPSDSFTLTPVENATFQEIERFIAEDMETVRNGEMTIKWYAEPTHRIFMNTALQLENIPDSLKNIASNAAPEPDYWPLNNIPGYQQMNHGYVLGIGGFAPGNFGLYANKAKLLFISHDYSGSFTNLGYANHYITDLGNPYHTPPIQLIPLEYIDSPYSQVIFPNSQMILNYKILHDKYEEMVADHWSVMYTSNQDWYNINDPTSSAQAHGTASWVMSYPLIYDCYWHFINNYNFDFASNSVIVIITRNRVDESMKNTRGLVRYVTGGQYPMLTIDATAGPGGSVSPSGAVSVRYDESQLFSIIPDSGYVIDEILVDGSPVTQNPYTFTEVITDHTISVTFTPIQTSTEWNWATDGWGDWQHSATWSGGSGAEYGPVMVDNAEGYHGEHGTDVSLSGGSTQSSAWKTFTDPSGIGWNTITFNGLMTASDVPSGRWMTIDVNNNKVFGGTASQSPPGNGVPFEIRRSFTQSPTVTVKISNGQSPAWGPRFAIHYYSVKLSRESTASLLTTQDSQFVIPDGSGLITNGTSQPV